jgi:hypothetical protein
MLLMGPFDWIPKAVEAGGPYQRLSGNEFPVLGCDKSSSGQRFRDIRWQMFGTGALGVAFVTRRRHAS